ncbi:MAG: energy transducer TonB [Pseudomonadales bacterium]
MSHRFSIVCLSIWLFASPANSSAAEKNDKQVGSGKAGRLLPRVELKQCKPATERGPKIRRGRLPRYPAAEFYNGKPGEVVIRFDVTEEGQTDNIEIVRSTSKSFMIQAGAAVEDWRFRPARNGREKVRVTCTQRYAFEIQY